MRWAFPSVHNESSTRTASVQMISMSSGERSRSDFIGCFDLLRSRTQAPSPRSRTLPEVPLWRAPPSRSRDGDRAQPVVSPPQSCRSEAQSHRWLGGREAIRGAAQDRRRIRLEGSELPPRLVRGLRCRLVPLPSSQVTNTTTRVFPFASSTKIWRSSANVFWMYASVARALRMTSFLLSFVSAAKSLRRATSLSRRLTVTRETAGREGGGCRRSSGNGVCACEDAEAVRYT